MKRREFSRTLIAAGAATPFLGAAPALGRVKDDKNGNDRPPFGRVELRLSSQVVIPTRLIVAQDGFFDEIGLEPVFPLSNENRIGLLNPTLRKTFMGADDVGDVALQGSDLIARPTQPITLGTIFLLNRSTSYRINAGKLAQQRTGKVPLLGDLPVIGSMFRFKGGQKEKRGLLILIRPTILDDAMS